MVTQPLLAAEARSTVHTIDRHATAIARVELSRPAALSLVDRLLLPGASFFDYGCGRGDDVRLLISLGYEAATYFNKYPGRFISIHLQDWSPTDKKQVAVGQGTVDWKKLFAAAKKGGVKNYFVELNMDAMKASYPYLHDLKV